MGDCEEMDDWKSGGRISDLGLGRVCGRLDGLGPFEVKMEKTDFGCVRYYNCGQGRFALYWYDDDKTRLYLANVDIWKGFRGRGLGNELLGKALEEARGLSKRLGFRELFLNCGKSSFAHGWYEKFGFEDFKAHERDPGRVWMVKTLRGPDGGFKRKKKK